MELFDVHYTNSSGKKMKARYCCKDKSEAKRVFYTEAKEDEIIQRVVKVK